MDVILKWIGGGTVAAALVLSGIAIGGNSKAAVAPLRILAPSTVTKLGQNPLLHE